MSTIPIQGQLLEITVRKCNNLTDTQRFSKQDPYVCVEYGGTKYRTRTCKDGAKNPIFQDKFSFTLIEGLREFIVTVYNSNNLSKDDFIGKGSVPLQKLISQGQDDSAWPIFSASGKSAGEVCLVLYCSGLMQQGPSCASPPASYNVNQHPFQFQPPVNHYHPPPVNHYHPHPVQSYAPPPASYAPSAPVQPYPNPPANHCPQPPVQPGNPYHQPTAYYAASPYPPSCPSPSLYTPSCPSPSLYPPSCPSPSHPHQAYPPQNPPYTYYRSGA